jgi:hypothetical protein
VIPGKDTVMKNARIVGSLLAILACASCATVPPPLCPVAPPVAPQPHDSAGTGPSSASTLLASLQAAPGVAWLRDVLDP